MLAKRNTLFLLLLQIAFSAGEWGLDSLGARIEQEVQESLKPLDNLNSLGTRIEQQVQESLKPLDNLGEKISRQIKEQLQGLDNLGERINQQVYRDLEPVRIMESMMKVRFGNGGTTIATFAPSGKQLIVRNGEHFVCEGNINTETGECGGALKKMQLLQDQDFCYVTSKNVINEWYCIAPNSNFRTISYINGKITCETSDGSPRLLIERTKFDNMCKNVANSVTYKHFTMAPLTDIGNEMKCSGERPQVCSFSESLNKVNSASVVING